MPLSGRELSSTGKVCTIECHGRVDNQQREPCLAHHFGRLVEQFKLMLGIVGAGISDVVEHFFSRETIAICHGKKPDRSKCAFGVNVKTFSFSTTHVKR